MLNSARLGLEAGNSSVLKKLLFVILLFVFTQHSFTQDVSVSAHVDSNNIVIGDWLKIDFEVDRPADVAVTWPPIADALHGFEIVKPGKVETQSTENRIRERSSFVVTAFDSGVHVIPPFAFSYKQKSVDSPVQIETQPLIIVVTTVPVDTSAEIKDIKPPIRVPITLAEILPYLIAFIGVAGVAIVLYYFWKKRKRGEPFFAQKPLRPSHEVALEALRILEAEHLWQRGKVKEYHSEVTEILRAYIERSCNVKALEMTTDEILDSRAILDLPNDVRKMLDEVLLRADLVKFAKFLPMPEENVASLGSSRSFVEATRPRAFEQLLITEEAQ